MNLVKIANDMKYNSIYSWLSQAEFLARLESVGIKLTAETIRNWERRDLITPPYRVGQAKGRRVEYCEFALAESYAIYSMTQSPLSLMISSTSVAIPKLTMAHVTIARRMFYKHVEPLGFAVPGYPKPPKATYSLHYLDLCEDVEFENSLPTINFTVGDDGTLKALKAEEKFISLDKHLEQQMFQMMYAAWFYALKKGCDTFLGDYRL